MSAFHFPMAHDESMRKRGTQEGSVRQKDGKWYGSYFRYVAGLNGDLKYQRKEVALDATTKRAAKAELREKYVSQANAQAAVPEGAPTTKPLKTNGEGKTPPGTVEDVPSADCGLSGPKLRNNCGSQLPPASGWRSMASFDPSRKCLAVVVHPGMLDAICIVTPCADGEHWRSQNGFLYGIEEIRAWAPIPEWTGEVSD